MLYPGVGLRWHWERCVVCGLLVWKAGLSVEEAVSMLTDVEMGFTNLERQSAALFFGSRNPFESDAVCGKFQTPSVDLIVRIFPI